MHISILAALAAASVSLVEAQSVSLSGFPQCAVSDKTLNLCQYMPADSLIQRGPISAGLKSTPCNLGDFPCICSSGEFVSALTTNVQAACSVADQQSNVSLPSQIRSSLTCYVPATLKTAQGLCSPFGVVLNVPAIAAAQPAAESATAPSAAQAASSPQAEAATAQTPTAADDTSAEASMDETMTSAPVSPDAFSSSSSTPDAAGPTSGPTSMASDAGDAGGAGPPAATMATATATATSSTTTSTSSLLVYDTKSVVPSATVAMPTDAAAANKQMASSSSTGGSSYKSNSTANSTVAASSPMPYMGAAVRGHVQLASMLSMGTLGVVFCWL
ncbi:MAG: hypothetical protein LQ344_005740 [Seirophora lacunosa]|nr:MAG: hypothetical protein LQ344_005740 [Seirophora lacunosa]